MASNSWPAVILIDLDNTLHDFRIGSARARGAFADYIERSFGVPRDVVLARYDKLAIKEQPIAVDGRAARLARLRQLCSSWPQTARVDLDALVEVLDQTVVDNIVMYSEVAEAVEQLHAEARLMIVTEGYADTQKAVIDRLGPAVAKCELLATRAKGVSKANGSAYRLAAHLLDSPPESMLMIGDNWEWDVVAAAATGLWQVWVSTADEPVARLPSRYLGKIPSISNAVERLSAWRARVQATLRA